MTNELQQNRYDQLLRRVGALVGGGSKVSEVLSELFPMIDVENVPGELLLLGGTRLAFGGGTLTGAAGQRGKMQVFNPEDSNNIMTVTQLIVSVGTESVVRWGRSTAALTSGISTQIYRETRIPLTNLPLGQIRQESSVPQAPGTNQVRLNSSIPFILNDPNGIMILAPGEGLEVGPDLVAIALYTAFSWRERVAERSELNL